MNNSHPLPVALVRIALIGVMALVFAITPFSTARAQGPFQPICTVFADRLNLRAGPDVEIYPIVGKLVPGTLVNITGRVADNSWVQIKVRETGATGWVNSAPEFIACLGLINAQPVLAPPPPPPPPKPVVKTPAPAPAPVEAPATQALAPVDGIPAPVGLEYDGLGFVWDWGGFDLMPDDNWYFDVKIYADGGQEFPYAVKIPDMGALEHNGPNKWRYIKYTDFTCGSQWTIQIARRNADGSFAGFASPESQRLPTGQGCSSSSDGGGGGSDGDGEPTDPDDGDGGDPGPGQCSYCRAQRAP